MDFPHETRKKKTWMLIPLIVLSLAFAAFATRGLWRIGLPASVLPSLFVHQEPDQQSPDTADLIKLAPRILGFDSPKIYLILFLNNTELRPGGGFIGAYATVKMEKGKTNVLALEGSEILDKKTPASWKPEPPAPLRDHLKVDRWYFRDANWSPDFRESAKKTLELYAAEGGISADHIDAVVGITPTVLEELMKITGSLTVDGVTFNAGDVTEKLEYEVEYGYDERGVPFHERKQIIKPFMLALMGHVKDTFITHFSTYTKLLNRLADERQVMMYPIDASFTDLVGERGWSGKVTESSGDYLMWVDANLAALKTDHVMERNLSYSLASYDASQFIATTTMTYGHHGGFDWRTTRYRTYARIFVSKEAQLIGVHTATPQGEKIISAGEVDQGDELGKKWFGVFFSVEPGTTGSVQFVYSLPNEALFTQDGLYTLFVQKQLGASAHGLTVRADFDTTITSAEPGEMREKWGDKRYEYVGDLGEDRKFTVNF